jgi:hypothetical protein
MPDRRRTRNAKLTSDNYLLFVFAVRTKSTPDSASRKIKPSRRNRSRYRTVRSIPARKVAVSKDEPQYRSVIPGTGTGPRHHASTAMEVSL